MTLLTPNSTIPDEVTVMMLGINSVAIVGLFAKTLDQPHPTEVGNMGFVEGQTNFLGTFRHDTQNALLGSFV